MFDNLGGFELLALLVLALLVFGPEQLPKVAVQVGRALRTFRQMASGVTEDLRREIGIDEEMRRELRALDPRRMLDDEPPAPRRRAVAAEPAPFDPDAT